MNSKLIMGTVAVLIGISAAAAAQIKGTGTRVAITSVTASGTCGQAISGTVTINNETAIVYGAGFTTQFGNAVTNHPCIVGPQASKACGFTGPVLSCTAPQPFTVFGGKPNAYFSVVPKTITYGATGPFPTPQ